MSPKSFLLTAEVADYLADHNPTLDDVQRDLVTRTQELGGVASMQIAPEQGAFMTLVTQLLEVKFAVEVGTFTGYSALCIARGLARDGQLLCCDVSEEWTTIARDYWRKAGVDDRVELRIAPAIDTLRSLPSTPTIDLAFIDADKPSYIDYYEEILPRLSANGLLIVDNVLWSGRVMDDSIQDEDTKGIRAFNDYVSNDDRSEAVMLPVSDGLTLVRRR